MEGRVRFFTWPLALTPPPARGGASGRPGLGLSEHGGLWVAASELGLAGDGLQRRGCGRWDRLRTVSLRTGEAGAGRPPEAGCACRVDTVSTDQGARVWDSSPGSEHPHSPPTPSPQT